MATLLALETSADACSVALLHGAELTERHERVPRSHTQYLLPMVDELLSSSGLSLVALDAIAFGRGPGSFTGLRVCASVVQGLASAADLPCISVSSLQTLAMTALPAARQRGSRDILCCVDARMDEVYYAQFSIGENPVGEDWPRVVQDDALAAPESVQWTVEQGYAVGSGWRYAQRMGYRGAIAEPDLLPRAGALARLAERSLAAGDVVAPARALPVYLRDDVAWR